VAAVKVYQPGVRVKTRNTTSVRLEIAKYLVMRYAPEIELAIARIDELGVLDLQRRALEPNRIRWSPVEGLTVLLHELGHHRTLARLSPLTDTRECGVLEEAVAWWWAREPHEPRICGSTTRRPNGASRIMLGIFRCNSSGATGARNVGRTPKPLKIAVHPSLFDRPEIRRSPPRGTPSNA